MSKCILRKNEPLDDNKDELLVFGYSCKLFRDDEKALHIDQGKHLIPWMGDETLRIDRYDGRGALYEVASLEPPPGGYDWRHLLTDTEKRIEQVCDEERYRALYCNEDEEEMYKEEELKRLHAARASGNIGKSASYGEVAFNYDSNDSNPKKAEVAASSAEKEAEEDPFLAPKELVLSDDVVLPTTNKHHMIIVKTASFIASQGAQMEILLKTKQAGNSQFDFLSKESPLYNYYSQVLEGIKNGVLRPQTEEVEEKEQQPPVVSSYLHPSLITPDPIEAAPFIPNINYKPSADCAYSILVNKITGKKPALPPEDESEKVEPFADGDLAPPGTQPLTLPKDVPQSDATTGYTQEQLAQYYAYYGYAYHVPDGQIEKGPILYGRPENAEAPAEALAQLKPPGVDDDDNAQQKKKSLGLNLIAYSDSEGSDMSDEHEDGPSAILMPPAETQLVIDKMAAYVVKNGADFEKVVIAKNDPRFSFLNPAHQYHAYYKSKLVTNNKPKPESKMKESDDSESEKEVEPKKIKASETTKEVAVKKLSERPPSDKKMKKIVPVSFSIKKLKEPDPILTNTALPYESSTDEEENGESGTKSDTKSPKGSQTSETDNITSRIQPKQRVKSVNPDEVITIDEDFEPTELIDLTGDVSDGGFSANGIVGGKQKQIERKRRAAAFLAVMKVRGPEESPAPQAVVALPPINNPLVERNTLASVMVKTLLDMQTKKEHEDNSKSKHRRKRRRYGDYQDASTDDSDHGQPISDRKEKYRKKGKRRKYSKSERPYKKSSKHRKEHSHRDSSSRKKSKRRSRSLSKKSEKCLDLLKKLEDNIEFKKEKVKSPPKPAKIDMFDFGEIVTNANEAANVKVTAHSEGEIEQSAEESGEISSSGSSSGSDTK